MSKLSSFSLIEDGIVKFVYDKNGNGKIDSGEAYCYQNDGDKIKQKFLF